MSARQIGTRGKCEPYLGRGRAGLLHTIVSSRWAHGRTLESQPCMRESGERVTVRDDRQAARRYCRDDFLGTPRQAQRIHIPKPGRSPLCGGEWRSHQGFIHLEFAVDIQGKLAVIGLVKSCLLPVPTDASFVIF
ncbi:hypothetical protein PDE_05452 [Penicillium oxalicum 114-2]|uniref:Uncharacterized protein n=1 Tax=Penicillium oxalicum (strain 114-2 / CGMCC 5302) TaxID=933388 RepID=S7ZPC6_PENO1|nr:hypothetical protein PDE_05452 [Penicillium oxalicum 114-2]